MFFTPTLKSDWFYVHKTVQCLMVILLVTMLVMPILHQPPKAEAIGPLAIVIAIVAVDVALIVGGLAWEAAQPKPCPGGCDELVSNPEADKNPCGNCQKVIYTCVTPTEHEAYCDGCGELHYTCDKTSVQESEEPRYKHRKIDSDCGIHQHHACKPENNHPLNTADCGIHSYPGCSPELNHFPVNTLCDHSVYTCTVGHEDVFCDPCLIFYPACEDHECPPRDDSSGCCDDSSGCCDDGS